MQSIDFLEKIARLKIEDLDQIKGFGPILAKNLTDFTASSRFENLLEKLRKLQDRSIKIEIINTSTLSIIGPLTDQVICITGSFDIARPEIKKYLSSLGANVSESVTKKTTILLMGADAGSKAEKARELGIKIFESIKDIEKEFKI